MKYSELFLNYIRTGKISSEQYKMNIVMNNILLKPQIAPNNEANEFDTLAKLHFEKMTENYFKSKSQVQFNNFLIPPSHYWLQKIEIISAAATSLIKMYFDIQASISSNKNQCLGFLINKNMDIETCTLAGYKLIGKDISVYPIGKVDNLNDQEILKKLDNYFDVSIGQCDFLSCRIIKFQKTLNNRNCKLVSCKRYNSKQDIFIFKYSYLP